MQTFKLSEIATIGSGLAPSRKKEVEMSDAKDVRIISVKDIATNSSVIREDIGKLEKISDEKILGKFILSENDIVITAKGSAIRSAVYKESDTCIVPTSNLSVIKTKNSEVLPEYLNVFLNLDRTVDAIKSKLTGTTIMSLSKKDLGQVEILVPNLEEQEKLVRLAQEKERFIKAREDEIKYMDVIVENTITNEIYNEENNEK